MILMPPKIGLLAATYASLNAMPYKCYKKQHGYSLTIILTLGDYVFSISIKVSIVKSPQ